MKRTLSFLLALLLAPALSQAVTCCTSGGAISGPIVDKDSNGKLVLRVLSVDATGTVVTGTTGAGTSNVTVTNFPTAQPTPSAGYASQTLQTAGNASLTSISLGVAQGATAVGQGNSFGYTTTTANGTAGRGGSYTVVALTGAYSMNVTFAAGVNAPCIVTIYPGSGPNASFLWNIMPAWLAPNTPIAVSTTPMMFTAGIGDFLNLSVTGAALSVTAQVRYAPIQ